MRRYGAALLVCSSALLGASGFEGAPKIFPRAPVLDPVPKFPVVPPKPWFPKPIPRQPVLKPPPPSAEELRKRQLLAESLPKIVPRQPRLVKSWQDREAEARAALGAYMVRAHEEKLAASAQSDARARALESELEALRQNLAESQAGLAAAVKRADAAAQQVVDERARAAAELATHREAFANHLIVSHERALQETAALKKELAEKTKELEEMSAEFTELKGLLTDHVLRSDEILERQGDELRLANKRLA